MKGISRNSFQDSFICNNKVSADKVTIANGFNYLFVNLGNKIKTVKGKSIYVYIRNQPNASMFLNATDEQELLQIVNNIKGKPSEDFEGIDMFIVK